METVCYNILDPENMPDRVSDGLAVIAIDFWKRHGVKIASINFTVDTSQ